MRSRQRTLNRSGALEPERIDRRSAHAVAGNGPRMATVAESPQPALVNDFVSCDRESRGNGSGAGEGSLFEQRHGPPGAPDVPLPQHDPALPRRLSGGADEPDVLPQHEWRGCDARVQCGHSAANVGSARPDLGAAEHITQPPQLQAGDGSVSTGTSMAESHTRTFTVMLSQSRMTPVWLIRPPRLRSHVTVRPLDRKPNSTLWFLSGSVKNREKSHTPCGC